MWTIVGPHALNGRTPESFYGMLKRMGESKTKIQSVGEKHERYWEEVVAFIRQQQDIEPITTSPKFAYLERF